MRVVWLLIVVGTLCVPSIVRAAGSTPAQERAALDTALRLAGPQLYAHLPIVLVSALPGTASPGAEAWTVYDEHGKGDRIFVYTRSRAFRCASAQRSDQDQCLLKLASIVVHEGWHLRNGPDEAGAYEAQLAFLRLTEASAFLQLNETASQNIREVRRARDRALTDKRNARPQAGTGPVEHSSQGAAIYPSCPHGHSALSRASCRHVGSDAPDPPRRVEQCEETADDRLHADHRPPAAAL